MNDIPPKHTPDDMAAPGANLVSVYQAASGANSESFPVLKAFQDYIEAEREQARKRVVSLSIVFAIIISVVIVGFLTAGVFLLRSTSSWQDKAFELALERRAPAETPAPAAPAATPAPPAADIVEETVKEISKVTAALQSDIGKRIDGVSEISAQVHQKVSSQETELEKLRQELGQMKEQNDQLKGDVEAMRAAAAQPPPAAVAAAPVATVREAPALAEAAPKPAVEPRPPAAVADAPRFPAATKEPPAAPEGVKPPDAPRGMVISTLPVKSKNAGTIPWRVILPE